MNHKLFTIITISTIITLSGCSGKNITLQDYADKWFNDKTVEETSIKDSNTAKNEVIQEDKKTPVKRTTPKKNPAADVAWSSVSKRDVNNKGEGSMQKSLDKWTKEEWDPAFEGDEEQAKKDANASQHFTLQHYMDKRQKYLKSDKEKWEKSGKKKPKANYEKMNKLPVIGK